MSKPIDKNEWTNHFDVITNFGTTEHVRPHERQYECFKNAHMCTKVGGVMIHVVPEVGTFKGHCPCYYSIKFFKQLAEDNFYKIVDIIK